MMLKECVYPLSTGKTTLPRSPLNSCSREAEHIYDTIPANTPHFYGVLEGPTLESDYHGLEDDSERDEGARDKLQNCQDVLEVREKTKLFLFCQLVSSLINNFDDISTECFSHHQRRRK